MFSSAFGLLDLPEDLLLSILKWFCIRDLLRAERTSKDLRSLCNARVLWVTLLKTLDIQRAPRFAPHERFETLSTQEIRCRAIRAMKSPRIWSQPETLCVKDITTLDARCLLPAEFPISTFRLKPQIIPGGEYVLLERDGQVEIWSVRSSTRLWAGPEAAEHGACYSFGAELQEGGNILIVAAAFRAQEGSKSHVCVFEIPLRGHGSRTLSQCNIPMRSLAPLGVQDDIIMIRHYTDHAVFLLNWKENRGLKLHFRSDDVDINASAAICVNTHLLLLLNIGALTLLAIPLSSLDSRWAPVAAEFDIEPVYIDLQSATLANPYPEDWTGLHLLRLNLAEPQDSKEGPWAITLHAFTPPWKHGDDSVPLEVFVVGYGNTPSTNDTMNANALLSWRLQLGRAPSERVRVTRPTDPPTSSRNPNLSVQVSTDTWHLTLLTSTRTAASSLPWNAKAITNAGRMLSFYKGLCSFELFSDMPQPTTILQPDSHALIDHTAAYSMETMDPFSGVLAIQTPDGIKVVEFE